MDTFDLARTEIESLADTYGLRSPPIGTIPGTTSVYRHGPRDIFMAEELLSRGTERQVRKVAAHEFFHYLQHENGKNMNIKPVRELEAESMALRWINGDRPQVPMVSRPMQDFQSIQNLRNLAFNWKPGLSSCGFDVTELSSSEDTGFLSIVRRIMGRE
jgi:hypothetical protein